MTTSYLQNGYFDLGGGTIRLYPEDSDPSTTFSFTFDGDLEKGDVVTVNYPNGAVENLEYFGLDANGDPGFVEVGQSATATNATKFFTDSTYGSGSAFPAFNDTEEYYCFLTGTLIATATGAVPVEDLSIGDQVLTQDRRAVAVKWVGRQTIVARFGIREDQRPVLIRAGALGNSLPSRDLRVTSSHALMIDGVLVNAAALINGVSIRRVSAEELGERFVVYHLETEDHDVVLAEGQPVETFIDNVSRRRFDNYAEYEALYGPTRDAMKELDLPRAMSARQVPATIRDRIAAATAALAVPDAAAA